MLTFFQTKQVIINIHLIESAVDFRAQIELLCEDICLWLEGWKKLTKILEQFLTPEEVIGIQKKFLIINREDEVEEVNDEV
jgi:hypothetical protein